MIYLDNAATTPMYPEVIEVMQKSMQENFGNPSSTHQVGRKAKSAIETARKNIARQFNVSASEIIFTSSGTEADNLILQNAINNLGVLRVITSKIEHNAVLNTVSYLEKAKEIKVDYVKVNEFGEVSLLHLEELLKEEKGKTLVSLMLVNNEIGSLLPVTEVCNLCKKYTALFHSDTVQAVGQYQIDLQKTPIDFIAASAHKFHGPKGVGFAYFKKGFGVQPILYGGNQEKGARSSTENVHSILGMEKALMLSCVNLKGVNKNKKELKKYCIDLLKKLDVGIEFNGNSADVEKSTHKILSIRLPVVDAMLLFHLDLMGLAVSGGSACQSGANKGSYVLQTFLNKEEQQKTSLRLSFSKFTTKKDIEQAVKIIEKTIKHK